MLCFGDFSGTIKNVPKNCNLEKIMKKPKMILDLKIENIFFRSKRMYV